MMKTIKKDSGSIFKKTLLFAAISSIATSAIAQDYASQLTLRGTSAQVANTQSSNQGGQQPQVRQEVVLLDPEIEAPLNIDALDYELLLYENEALQIEAKRRALAKKLYERQQLRDLRGILQEDIRVEAVDDAKLGISPLTAEEIRQIRAYKEEITHAENAPLQPVEQLIRTVDVDLSSNQPITVFVSANNQSNIVFFDRSGEPWPIVGEPIHNTEAFKSFKTGEKEHIAVFTIEREFSESNAMINLKGLDIPIPVRLVGTQSKVDARLSARIPRFGPLMQEQPRFYGQTTVEASEELLAVHNGDHVKDSLVYDIVDRESNRNLGRAYYRDGRLYVRSPYELVIPQPIEATNMLSGYMAFVAPAREDLLLNVDGKHIEAKLAKAISLDLRKKESIFEE